MSTITRIIDNCNFKWAKLEKPVNPFGDGDAWELQIYSEDLEVAEEWAKQNLNVKSRKNEDGALEFYVNLKRWTTKPATGEKYDPPVVVDGDKNPISGGNIGNGSKGKVKVYQYEWHNGMNSGIATILIAVQVTDLIKYVPSEVVDF